MTALTSRYRCRTHPNQPVTWKGTGCPDCTRERRRRPRPESRADYLDAITTERTST